MNRQTLVIEIPVGEGTATPNLRALLQLVEHLTRELKVKAPTDLGPTLPKTLHRSLTDAERCGSWRILALRDGP